MMVTDRIDPGALWSGRIRPLLSHMLCYVAVCNNYAVCNTLQTALNCNAVCNTSYFKLRCESNAICNVLQIASKFYHLKILKRRIKLINCKIHRFNNILLWIQLDTNLFELIFASQVSDPLHSSPPWRIWAGFESSPILNRTELIASNQITSYKTSLECVGNGGTQVDDLSNC